MLKQGVKTISAEFIRKGALSQLSFIQFRPYATSFWGLLLSLTLMPKSKKSMETSLDLTLSFKTSIDARIEGLVSNVDYLEIRHCNFIQKKYGRKRHLLHRRFVLWLYFFCMIFLHSWWLLKVKKIANKALSKQSKQSLLLFHFLVWRIEFPNSI